MKTRTRCLVFSFLALCFAGRMADAQQVTTRLSKTQVSLDEGVELTLEYQGRPAQSPDLSPLQRDFEIVNRRVNQRVSIVNGQRSQRSGVTLHLLPKRTGVLEIPAIAFGDHWSQAQTIEVLESPIVPGAIPGDQHAVAPRLHIEVEAQPRQPKVLEQVLLIVRVQGSDPLLAVQLSAPQLGGASTRMLALGEDRYPLQGDGHSPSVYERRYALFPQETGTLSIAPILAETKPRGGWDGWPEFGYGAGPFAPRNGTRGMHKVQSQPLELQVAPAPQDLGAGDWLPARNLRLTDGWPDALEFEAGQPIVRTITLEAEGVSAGFLPAIPMDVPSGMRKYAQQPYLRDQPSRDGVLGTRQERLTLVPAEAGVYHLPKIVIDWWNTASHQWETASLPAREIAVSPAGPSPRSVASRPSVASLSSAPSWTTAMPSLADSQVWDKAPEPRHEQAPLAESATPPPDPSPSYWPWVVALLGLGWLVTLTAWRFAKRRPPAPPPPQAPITEEPQASYQESEWIGALKKSYHASDAGAARAALLGWARSMWPEQPPSNLSRLALRCPEPLRQEIIKLENALYSPKPHAWNEQPVWDWVRAYESQHVAAARPRAP